MNIVDKITKSQLKKDVVEFRVGDTVRVGVKIKEGNKERIQEFEGLVIAKQNGGISENFTVRKKSGGIGVERIFPVHSPKVSHINVIRKGKVRRAKLGGFLRKMAGQYKVKERN